MAAQQLHILEKGLLSWAMPDCQSIDATTALENDHVCSLLTIETLSVALHVKIRPV